MNKSATDVMQEILVSALLDPPTSEPRTATVRLDGIEIPCVVHPGSLGGSLWDYASADEYTIWRFALNADAPE